MRAGQVEGPDPVRQPDDPADDHRRLSDNILREEQLPTEQPGGGERATAPTVQAGGARGRGQARVDHQRQAGGDRVKGVSRCDSLEMPPL